MLKYRPQNENDKFLIEKWVANDPEHSKTSEPSFWVTPSVPEKHTKYIVVEDSVGTVAYLVLENVLRIHCQFAPSTETDRIRAAAEEFLPKLKKESSENYKQVIAEAVSAPLVWFLRKFGFRKSKNELVCKTGVT